MPPKSPIQFLITHKEIILKAYEQSDRKPGKTWQSLQGTLPQLSKAMSLNTFKQYLSVFVVFNYELDRVIEENKQVRQELDKTWRQKAELQVRLKRLEKKLDKVRQKNSVEEKVIHKLDSPPKRIAGWSIQKGKDGYYRCYRKIGNKVHSLYIGKVFDAKKARTRVKEKEERLRLDKG